MQRSGAKVLDREAALVLVEELAELQARFDRLRTGLAQLLEQSRPDAPTPDQPASAPPAQPAPGSTGNSGQISRENRGGKGAR